MNMYINYKNYVYHIQIEHTLFFIYKTINASLYRYCKCMNDSQLMRFHFLKYVRHIFCQNLFSYKIFQCRVSWPIGIIQYGWRDPAALDQVTK